MKSKLLLALILFLTVTTLTPPSTAYAVGVREGAASLILPTTGQAMNGELGKGKTKLMAGLEFSLITGTALIGGLVGGPAVWFAAGPLVVNHVWSSADAYRSAKRNYRNASTDNLQAAQQNLDLSRERRYDREQQYRSDIYDKVRAAGESQG